MNKKYTFIDLFAGIGGFHLALHNLGMECVFASEIDESARKTYKANFEDISPQLFENNEALFNKDITKQDISQIPDFDILCGGFPCQPFSISGKRKGFEDTRGTLFFDIARIVEYHKPKAIFLENVKNFLRHDSGRTLQTIISVLDKIGYNTFYKVLNASSFGVPTARQRLYIVSFRKDLCISDFTFPTKSGRPTSLFEILEEDNQETKMCEIVRNDIVLNNVSITRDVFGTYPQKPIRIGTINGGGQGERIYSPQGHSITLSAQGGGAGAKTGAYLINGIVRKLTRRECARVMGFPDNYKIVAPKVQVYKQFGNSVAVPVITAVTKELIKKLNNNTNHLSLWQKEKDIHQALVLL